MNKIEKRKLEEESNDISFILGSENGRRFLWRILSYCGIYKDIEGDDSAAMAKQIGRRRVGLYLLAILTEKDQEAAFTMMREAATREQEDKIELERLEKEDDLGEDNENQVSWLTDELI